MEFVVNCGYRERGKEVLDSYPQLKEYTHRLEKGELYITINSLDDLLKIKEKIKESLILDMAGELVIYDGYIE